MSSQFIQMNVEFNAPVETVFATLSDHEAMGKVLNAKVKRIKDGQDDVNGPQREDAELVGQLAWLG